MERSAESTRGGVLRGLLLAGVVAGVLLSLLSPRWMWGPHLAFEMGAFVCFVVLMSLEHRDGMLPRAAVVGVTGLLFAFAVVFPPRESADVWSFVMYGRIVLHGDNPYTTPPAEFPHDRWVHLVRPVWRETPSLYGPLFDVTAAAVVRASRGSALRARLEFQILAALAVAAAMLLLWRRTRDPTALAFLGLNPLVIIGVVNGAHSDALVGLAVLGGVLMAGRARPALAGLVLGVAALVKVVALLPAGIVVLWLWRRRGTGAALAAGAVTAVTSAAGYVALGRGEAWRAIVAERGLVTRFSSWRLATLGHHVADSAPDHHLNVAARPLSWVPIAAILLLALVAALPELRQDRPHRAASVATIAYLLAAPYVSPWYLMWVLPATALTWRSWPARLAVAQQAALTVAYALTLHKHFAPVATALRAGYFDVLAVAQAGAVLAIAGIAVVRLRGEGPGEAVLPTPRARPARARTEAG